MTLSTFSSSNFEISEALLGCGCHCSSGAGCGCNCSSGAGCGCSGGGGGQAGNGCEGQ